MVGQGRQRLPSFLLGCLGPPAQMGGDVEREVGRQGWTPPEGAHQAKWAGSLGPPQPPTATAKCGSRVRAGHTASSPHRAAGRGGPGGGCVGRPLTPCVSPRVSTPHYTPGLLVEKNDAYTKVFSRAGLTLMWNREDSVMVGAGAPGAWRGPGWAGSERPVASVGGEAGGLVMGRGEAPQGGGPPAETDALSHKVVRWPGRGGLPRPVAAHPCPAPPPLTAGAGQ